MLLYTSESLCLWFWANACFWTPLSLLNNIHIFVILLYKQVCSFISISCKEKCFSVCSCSSFYLSFATPHSFCSLAFDTSPMWACLQPRDGERFQRPLIPYILKKPSVANISVLCPGLCCYHLLSGGLDGVTVGYKPWLLAGLNLPPHFSLL